MLFIFFTIGCEDGLRPPSGFKGTVSFPHNQTQVEWPDSIQGAVVAFADASTIDVGNLSLDALIQNLLGFSQPLRETASQNYFLEALPGAYLAGVVGTTIPISELILQPIDSVLAHPEYFQLLGIYGFDTSSDLPLGLVIVPDDGVAENIDILADFNFQSVLVELF